MPNSFFSVWSVSTIESFIKSQVKEEEKSDLKQILTIQNENKQQFPWMVYIFLFFLESSAKNFSKSTWNYCEKGKYWIYVTIHFMQLFLHRVALSHLALRHLFLYTFKLSRMYSKVVQKNIFLFILLLITSTQTFMANSLIKTYKTHILYIYFNQAHQVVSTFHACMYTHSFLIA